MLMRKGARELYRHGVFTHHSHCDACVTRPSRAVHYHRACFALRSRRRTMLTATGDCRTVACRCTYEQRRVCVVCWRMTTTHLCQRMRTRGGHDDGKDGVRRQGAAKTRSKYSRRRATSSLVAKTAIEIATMHAARSDQRRRGRSCGHNLNTMAGQAIGSCVNIQLFQTRALTLESCVSVD